MDISQLKAKAYDKIREFEKIQAELNNLNNLIMQMEAVQAVPAPTKIERHTTDECASVN